MRVVWINRDVDAPAELMWDLLTDPDQWPRWGPSIRAAQVNGGQLELGATGTVTTVVGIDLNFEITDFEPGTFWAWKVAGVPATTHRVEALTQGRSRVGFGMPWPAAAYAVVCYAALRRLDSLAAER